MAVRALGHAVPTRPDLAPAGEGDPGIAGRVPGGRIPGGARGRPAAG